MTSYACQFGKNHQTPLVPLPTRAALLERNVQPCPRRRGGGRCGSCWDCLLPHEASPGQPTDQGTHTHVPPDVIPSGPGTCPGTTAAPHRKPVPRPKNSDFPPLPRPRSRPAQVSLPDEAGPPGSEGQPEMTAEHTLSRRPTEHPRLPTANAGQAFSLCHHGPKDGTRDSGRHCSRHVSQASHRELRRLPQVPQLGGSRTRVPAQAPRPRTPERCVTLPLGRDGNG